MSSWRFYPLAEFRTLGFLKPNNGSPVMAEYLTPQQAKAYAARKSTGTAKAGG